MTWRDGKSLIIEVETGFTSPENALDPQAYLTARAISKIARYSPHADRFSLATPAHNILQIPRTLLKPAEALGGPPRYSFSKASATNTTIGRPRSQSRSLEDEATRDLRDKRRPLGGCCRA
ncbi:MAG: hypothetical protein L2C94_007280 [Aigarchaeota archaeon]|nr:hypothetical protein [Candidatus Wolframiiraptor gerlachensis]